MSTVEEIVKDLEGSAPGDYGVIAAKWISNRYNELLRRVRPRIFRGIGELSVPAVYDTGTVTTTRGSTAVVGVGTAWDTTPGNGTQEHWYFRGRTAWYKISSITDDTNLVLASAWAEEALAAGTYKIVKRHHPIASNARWISSMYHDRRRRRLDIVPIETLDEYSPERTLVSADPLFAAQVGTDSDNTIIMELYPVSDLSELIHYLYWTVPSALTIDSTIPQQIDADILKEGALVDLYRYEKIVAAKAGNDTISATFANLEARQITLWESKIKEAYAAIGGVDDATVILKLRNRRIATADIKNAKDHWLVSHTRP